MNNNILTLEQFGVGFGNKVILASVTMNVPDRGIYVVMGPAGTGKSTLLRTISGHNNANPNLQTWGTALYLGAPFEKEYPKLVMQKAKLMMSDIRENMLSNLPERSNLSPLQQTETLQRLLNQHGLGKYVDKLDSHVVDLPLHIQRHLSILRSTLSGPRLILVDEPTAGLEENDIYSLLDYIKDESTRRAMLVILHNQLEVKYLNGRVALLAGGWIQEEAECEDFFNNPSSEITRGFIRTGSCWLPSPDARPEELDENLDPQPPTPPATPKILTRSENYVSDAFGPRGFLWLLKGVLAGTPRPGLINELKYDLKALKKVGITLLITLQTTPLDSSLLQPYGIEVLHYPITDMGAPDIGKTIEFCGLIHDRIEQGDVVAVHCKAGLGRTGTILAAYLIWCGENSITALERARNIEPRWVQSDEQVEFLEKFDQACKQFAVKSDMPV